MNALSKECKENKGYIEEYRTDISILLPRRRKGGGQLQNFAYYAKTEEELHKEVDLIIRTYFSKHQINNAVTTERGIKNHIQRQAGERFTLMSSAFEGENFFGCAIEITNAHPNKESHIKPAHIHEVLSSYKYVLYTTPDHMIDGIERYILVLFFGRGVVYDEYVEIRNAVIQLIDETNSNIDNSPVYKGRTWSLPLSFASAESHAKIIHNPGAFIKLPLGTATPTLRRPSPSSSLKDNSIKEDKVKSFFTNSTLTNVSLRLKPEDFENKSILAGRIMRVLDDPKMQYDNLSEAQRGVLGGHLKAAGIFFEVYHAWRVASNTVTDKSQEASFRLWNALRVSDKEGIGVQEIFMLAKRWGASNYLGLENKKSFLVFDQSLCDEAPPSIKIVMKYIMSKAFYPNKTLALAGAISCLGYFYQHRIEGPYGMRSNTYITILARSGYGKGAVTAAIDSLIAKYKFPNAFKRAPQSGGGLYTALKMRKNNLYLSINEFGDQFLEKLTHKNVPSYLSGILGDFTDLFTASKDKDFPFQHTVQDKKEFEEELLCYPHISILGTSVPETIMKAYGTSLGYKGLLSRIMVFYPEMHKIRSQVDFTEEDEKELDRLLKRIVRMPTLFINFDKKQTREILKIQFTKKAQIYYDEQLAVCDDYEQRYYNDSRKVESALYSRLCEHALKIAMIAHKDGYITLDIIKWAFKVADSCVRTVVNHLFYDDYNQTGFERKVKDLYITLRRLKERSGNRRISMTELSQHYRKCSAKEREGYLNSLEEQGLIKITHTSRHGKNQFTTEIEVF